MGGVGCTTHNGCPQRACKPAIQERIPVHSLTHSSIIQTIAGKPSQLWPSLSLELQQCTGEHNCGAHSQGNTTFNQSPIHQSTKKQVLRPTVHQAPARYCRCHNKQESFCASRSLQFSRKYRCPMFPFQSIKEIKPLTGHSSNGKEKSLDGQIPKCQNSAISLDKRNTPVYKVFLYVSILSLKFISMYSIYNHYERHNFHFEEAGLSSGNQLTSARNSGPQLRCTPSSVKQITKRKVCNLHGL